MSRPSRTARHRLLQSQPPEACYMRRRKTFCELIKGCQECFGVLRGLGNILGLSYLIDNEATAVKDEAFDHVSAFTTSWDCRGAHLF